MRPYWPHCALPRLRSGDILGYWRSDRFPSGMKWVESHRRSRRKPSRRELFDVVRPRAVFTHRCPMLRAFLRAGRTVIRGRARALAEATRSVVEPLEARALLSTSVL